MIKRDLPSPGRERAVNYRFSPLLAMTSLYQLKLFLRERDLPDTSLQLYHCQNAFAR
jgi:hypothetical protein